MARQYVQTTTVAIEPATGELKMPTSADFAALPVVKDEGSKPGRVEGIDYDLWAVALIDLNDAPDRVAGHRIRLTRKGYIKVEGNPIVQGWARPEVWCKPRNQHDRDRQALRARIEQKVATREWPDSAIVQGQVHRV
jgi:hypothetical protein